MEVTLATEHIYQGRVVNLRVDLVRLTNGRTTKREIVEHGDAVAILAVTPDRDLLLVQQYRKPVESELLEIPAGGVNAQEDPADAVRRELQEETGYVPGAVRHLATFYTSPGFCTETMHLYLATNLTPGQRQADEDEAITLVRVPLAQVPALIASGQIKDAKTLIGLLFLVTEGLW